MKKDVSAILKTIGESFLALSEIYATADAPAETKEAPKKKEKPAPTKEPAAEVKTYTKEEVRATLANKAKADGGKFKAEVKAIVAKYSSDGTLTKVPEDKYPDLMKELEVIGNA